MLPEVIFEELWANTVIAYNPYALEFNDHFSDVLKCLFAYYSYGIYT